MTAKSIHRCKGVRAAAPSGRRAAAATTARTEMCTIALTKMTEVDCDIDTPSPRSLMIW